MLGRRTLQRDRDGTVRLRLSREEREILAHLASELDARLSDGTEATDLRRLFPPAYADDPEEEAEYRELMRDDLLEGRRAARRVFVASLDAGKLSEEELGAWLTVLNDLRLVLGTRLDVGEEALLHGIDSSDPRAPDLALYGYLSWLQEQAVEAAADALPG